jgi:hypothetical protein
LILLAKSYKEATSKTTPSTLSSSAPGSIYSNVVLQVERFILTGLLSFKIGCIK